MPGDKLTDAEARAFMAQHKETLDALESEPYDEFTRSTFSVRLVAAERERDEAIERESALVAALQRIGSFSHPSHWAAHEARAALAARERAITDSHGRRAGVAQAVERYDGSRPSGAHRPEHRDERPEDAGTGTSPRPPVRDAVGEDAPLCANCGKPATCYGAYEHEKNPKEYACDECCGHGHFDHDEQPCAHCGYRRLQEQGVSGVTIVNTNVPSTNTANVSELRKYIAELEQADSADNAQFKRLVAASMSLLLLNNGEFAKKIGTSRSTVSRWRSGHAAPHPAMRRPVYAFLVKLAEATLHEALGREELAK